MSEKIKYEVELEDWALEWLRTKGPMIVNITGDDDSPLYAYFKIVEEDGEEFIDIDSLTSTVLEDVHDERTRQDKRWGTQNHPDGTGLDDWLWSLDPDLQKAENDRAVKRGDLTFADILVEELAEALAETDPVKLREELVQVAAVAVAWIEKLDREEDRRRG